MRRTAKGEMVDFDLIKAKQQMAEKPAPKAVSSRQEVIDRRLRKKAAAMAPSVLNTTPAKPEPKPVPAPVVKKEEIVEKEELEEIVEVVADTEEDEIEESSDDSEKPRRRQRTKPKPTN